MRAILAIAGKDLKLLVRDRGNAVFTFVFPVLLAVFFGVVFGGGGGGTIRVAVVNEGGAGPAQEFVEALGETAGIQTHAAPDRATAEAMVRRGAADASVVVPEGFDPTSFMQGRPARIEGVVDPRRSAEAGLLTGVLNQLVFQQMSGAFGDPERTRQMLDRARAGLRDAQGISPAEKLLFEGVFASLERLTGGLSQRAGEAPAPDAGPAAGFRPVEVELATLTDARRRPTSSFEISFPQGIVWGLMGCVTAFAVGLAEERARGTLTRLTVSPLTPGMILAGKALACFTACLIVQALLLAVGVIGFGVTVNDWAMMLAAVVCIGVGFTGVMMALAGLARTEGAASGMGRAVVLILAMIGGGTIPVFFMPPFLQTASGVSPFKWATVAVEGALWRQYTPAHMLLPAGVLLAIGAVGYLIGSAAFRRAGAS